jgi:hypothetical protein
VAQKLTFFHTGTSWADRDAINANADELDSVETDVGSLRTAMLRQNQEILRLRAMLMAVVEVLHAKAPFDDAELDSAFNAAWTQLTAPPPPIQQSQTGAPYRGAPVPVRMVTCVRCMRQVPASQTNITASGEVCDRCG